MRTRRAVFGIPGKLVLGLAAVVCAGAACDIAGRGAAREDGTSGAAGEPRPGGAAPAPDSPARAAAAPADSANGAADPAEAQGAAAGTGPTQAEQVVPLVPGAENVRVVLWADATPTALVRIRGSGGDGDGDGDGGEARVSCRIDSPAGITAQPRAIPRREGGSLTLTAGGDFTSGVLAVRCGNDAPMRIMLANPARIARPDSVPPGPTSPASDGFRFTDLLAGLALLGAVGAVAVLWRLTREVTGVSAAIRELVQRFPSGRTVEPPPAPDSSFDWGQGVERIEQCLRREAEGRDEVVRQLHALNETIARAGTVIAAPRESAPQVQLPIASIVGETAAAAAPSANGVRIPDNRLEKVFDTLYRNRGQVGGGGELQREAEQLERLTRGIAAAADLLGARLATLAGDERSRALEEALSRLRARCEQLAGRYSEFQMGAGLAAFPVRAYVYPTHSDVQSLADAVMTGLEESASLLAGRTDLLRQQFDQMVLEALRPTLAAANYLRAGDPEPDWMRAVCRALAPSSFRPQPGEGVSAQLHEVLSGSSLSINRVLASGYTYRNELLIPALVETDG